MVLLRVEGLDVRYQGVPAVRNLSFEIAKGEIFALLGPNGAGKSSTLSSIMGKVSEVSGVIEFGGESLIGKSPDEIARSGVSLVPEGRHIFSDLSVLENLKLGAMGGPSSKSLKAQNWKWTLELFPVLEPFFDRPAGVLSGGQQQQLAIARALMAAPDLLMLDEPSLGLAPTVVDAVFEAIGQIRDSGTTVILVEQRAARAARFADRSFIIASGVLRTTVDPSSEDLDGQIASAYFGRSSTQIPAASDE